MKMGFEPRFIILILQVIAPTSSKDFVGSLLECLDFGKKTVEIGKRLESIE